MNRTFLFALLGLSLAGNAWFLLAARPPAASASRASGSSAQLNPERHAAPVAQTGDASKPDFAAANADAPPATPRRGLTWRTPRNDDDYRALAADLRAAGFPPRLIHRVLSDLHGEQTLAQGPLGNAPYWQRTAVEQSKAMRAYRREERDQVSELLGPDGRPSARLDAVSHKRQYGNLPDVKIDAISALERDYQEMQSDIFSGGGMIVSESSTTQKQANLLKAEKLADLAKILTPAELVEYQLHNSDSARRTATFARDVPLTADEFAALVGARTTYDATEPVIGSTFSPELIQQRQAAQASYYEQIRATLPDGRFYDILERADPGYRAISGLRAQFPAVTPATAYQALQLQNEAQAARTALLRNRPTSDTIQSAYATWNARLDQLLGKEAAAAYRKTPQGGRAFNPPTIPRPTTGATPPKG